jgi:hypothetical protein
MQILASASVGQSGPNDGRCFAISATTLTLPDWIGPSPDEGVTQPTGTSPAATAIAAGAPPR